MRDIANKLILITGGAGGIGRLMGLDFAGRGARVVAWDLDAGALAKLEDEGRQKKVFIKGMVCDVSDREAVYRQAAALREELGPVDVLINNAGVVSGAAFLETPDEKIIRTMQVNTFPLFWTCKAFLPSMIERNSGHLVTIASAAGIIGVRGLADYSASKFAAFGFDEAVRMDLRSMKSAVKTTVICPFFIDTGMFLGVKTRFPLLMPILKDTKAAKRIVRAVLKNKKRLIMPAFVHMVYFLRLLPTAILDMTADFFGINKAMNEYRGRESK
jgi:all-trans-retinol dehydrogenase (NAD+)